MARTPRRSAATPPQPTWRDLELGPHQTASVELIESYLASSGRSRPTAFLHLPYGTGKTAVVAVAAHCLSEAPSALILTGSRPDRKRMRQAIARSPVATKRPKKVLNLEPATASRYLATHGGREMILIGTLDDLARLLRDDPESFAVLRRKIALVLVDRGGDEPPPAWPKTVRSLRRPIILITPTPYFENFAGLRLDRRHLFSYCHRQAVQDGVLRSVEIGDLPPPHSPEDFATALVAHCRELEATTGEEAPKVIVSCGDLQSLNAVYEALVQRAGERQVAAAHPSFPAVRANEGQTGIRRFGRHRRPPAPKARSARFWLTLGPRVEELADPAFRVLAVYDQPTSSRDLVRQVSAVLRPGPDEDPGATARVLACPAATLRRAWETYLTLEEAAAEAAYFVEPPPTWHDLSLWPHQADAVRMVERYLKRRASNRDMTGSALVHMPTGTGKTGAIAAITHCLKQVGGALVLTPRRSLKRQMADDLGHAFWQVMGVDPGRWSKAVASITPATLDATLDNLGDQTAIFVGTIQGLQMLHDKEKYRDAYQRLSQRISVVVVDEGHYEPAPDWARAVRGLDCPAVLFTATPYRNDFLEFCVDGWYVTTYSLPQAVDDRFIRKVEFREVDVALPPAGVTGEDDLALPARRFVDTLLAFYDDEFLQLKPSAVKEPKVIVRCRSQSAVAQIATLLEQRGREVVAVHDRFPEGSKATFLGRVPDPRTRTETFWVHQYMLMEGLDDPSFCLLALYQPFANTRSLVQQVGRVLRNPSRKSRQTCYVLAARGHRQRELWQGFLAFEEQSEDRKYLTALAQKPLEEILLEAQPGVQYVDGDFRRVLTPEDLDDLPEELLFRRSVNVYRLREKPRRKSFTPEGLRRAVAGSLADLRRRILGEHWDPERREGLYLFQAARNSPILRSLAYIECQLGYAFFRQAGDYLFFTHLHAAVPDYFHDVARPVPARDLQRLFPTLGRESDDARLTQVALSNTDVGAHAVRSRTLRAANIAETAPSIGDFANFCTSASGTTPWNRHRVRRYVGFGRARVTDSGDPPCTYSDFLAWQGDLATALRQQGKRPIPVFGRFARFTDPPADTRPRNILLDLEETRESFELASTAEALEFEDICLDCRRVGDRHVFTLRANRRDYAIDIRYDRDRDRYHLDSSDLETAYVSREIDEKSLISFLNRSQSFRVVPEPTGYIYAHGHWYQPRLKLIGGKVSERLALMNLLHPVAGLKTATEKGKSCRNFRRGWQRGSLFDILDHRGRCRSSRKNALAQKMEHMDLLICDDMDTEIADFIGADTENREVAFMHAKDFRGAVRSASKFHDVCSQAVKNLDYVCSSSVRKPPNLGRWGNPWRSGGVKGEVATRLRGGPFDSGDPEWPEKAWTRVRAIERDPTSHKAVWIVIGRGFSKGEFEDRLRRKKPAAEDVQVVYLIQSTWAAIAEVGAELHVFCSP